MGFLDKAKQAASDLASKADSALNNSGMGGPGDVDKMFKQLGQLSFNEATGKPFDPAEKHRLIQAIEAEHARGAAYTGGPPPPPGANAANPAPSAMDGGQTGGMSGGVAGSAGGTSAPPPPPPPGFGDPSSGDQAHEGSTYTARLDRNDGETGHTETGHTGQPDPSRDDRGHEHGGGSQPPPPPRF